MTGVHIRPVELRDLGTCGDISISVTLDDELFDWLAPGRYVYPLGWRRNSSRRLHMQFLQNGSWGYVAVPSAAPEDHDKIMGYAFWVRAPSPETAKTDPWSRNRTSWADALNRTLLNLEQRWDVLVRGTPAANYEAMATFHGPPEGDNKVLGPLEAGVAHWHLSALAIDPAYHRRGVGSAMVRHGMDLARKETRESGLSVPISLIATPNGSKLYKHLGFRTMDWILIPQIPDQQGGSAMVWDETDTWILPSGEVKGKKGRMIDAVWSQRALDVLEASQSKTG